MEKFMTNNGHLGIVKHSTTRGVQYTGFRLLSEDEKLVRAEEQREENEKVFDNTEISLKNEEIKPLLSSIEKIIGKLITVEPPHMEPPLIPRNTITEEPPLIPRNTITEEPPPIPRNTITEEPPPIPRNTITEEPPPIPRNPIINDPPHMEPPPIPRKSRNEESLDKFLAHQAKIYSQ
jgi:hypothetical protein